MLQQVINTEMLSCEQAEVSGQEKLEDRHKFVKIGAKVRKKNGEQLTLNS